MNAQQARTLKPGMRVRWTLQDRPELGVAVLLDPNPAKPESPYLPAQPRGRYVRIGWPSAPDRPYVDVWSDDLLLVC